ncbi:PAS domain S-box protein [Kamptonema sp. UHCC 0994]|uniref:PAS domain S-box protein n=1 Tax=Kamptonema sp. UHCC 0994 TaxID=3031329 RepID=UPI0031BA7F59
MTQKAISQGFSALETILPGVSKQKHLWQAWQRLWNILVRQLEDASIGMAILSLDGHFLKANPVLCQIIGYSPEELLGLTFESITHPDDLEADIKNVNQLVTGKMSSYSQREKRYIHKQGHIVWSLLNASVITDKEGNPLNLIAHIQDITARKEAQ